MWDLASYGINIYTTCLCAALVLLASRRVKRHSSRLPLPPGPPRRRIIGNVHQMPRSRLWETATEWGKQYGDIVYIENFGISMVFLNSFEAVSDLLVKRSAIYSSRPRNVMSIDLLGWGWVMTQLPYGETLRKQRAYLHRFFQSPDSVNYLELQARETVVMLNGILNTPEEYARHVGRVPGAVTLRNVFGYETKERDDPLLNLAQEAFRSASQAPKYIFLNFAPWLKYLPSWFPGAGFQTFAKEGRQLQESYRRIPYEMARKKFLDGSGKECMTSVLLNENMVGNGSFRDEQTIADAASVAILGSSDTSVTAIMTFILAMLKFPEVQRRGQEEIDAVIGSDRLPTSSDRESLPYVQAICTEIFRWEIILPIGLPHALTADDEYMGYRIPAGTMVAANLWAISRDPVRYPDPHSFKPERWVPDGTTEGGVPSIRPQDYAFGFGRRVCPGQSWAENIVFLAVASILATFNIEKAIGKDGIPIPPNDQFNPIPVRTIGPSECKITPRSEKAVSLIQQAFASL